MGSVDAKPWQRLQTEGAEVQRMAGGKGERKLHGRLSRSETSGNIQHSAVKAVEEEGQRRTMPNPGREEACNKHI